VRGALRSRSKDREQARSYSKIQPRLRVDAVFKELARLEGHGVAGFDGHWLTGLRVLPGPCTAMALDKRTETDQRDAVFAVQGVGDFFEHCIEYAAGLLFGEGQPFQR
jgi:hypothetical protein